MERFGPPKNAGMTQLLKERYTINDAVRYREPREYAIAIVRAAQVARLDTVHHQLNIIWNGLDMEFQSDIDPPDTNITLNQFLANMDRRKHQWWQKASRMRPSSGATIAPSRSLLQGPSQRSNNTGQYNNPRGSLSRSFSSGNQNYGSRQQPFTPSYRQNNAYNPQYQQRYQGNQSYGNPPAQGYQSYQSYQTYQPRPQQQQLPQLLTPPQPRQIMAGPTLSQQNGSGSRQYGNNPPYNSNNYRSNNPPQQP